MKHTIHPPYFPNAKVTCNCGASFEVGATLESIHVEICSECHPFYTGKSHLVDTAGRVDKFKARTERAAVIKASAKAKSNKNEAKTKPAKKSDTVSRQRSGNDQLKELRKSVL